MSAGDPTEDAIPRLLDGHGGRVFVQERRSCRLAEDAGDRASAMLLPTYGKRPAFEAMQATVTFIGDAP